MVGFEGAGPPVGLARSFTEPDHFAAALLGGQFDYLPVREEPFAATLRVLMVGDMVVQHADTSAHVARGGIASGMAVLMVNLQETHRPARVNGTEVAAAEAVLAVGGAEITGHNPERLNWAALALPVALLEELAELAPPQVRVQGALRVLMLPPDGAARLRGALSAASRMAESLPAELSAPDCAAGLAMALREAVAAALTAEAEVRPRQRAVAEALRLVGAA